MLKGIRTAKELANLKSENSELVADGMLHEKSRIMIAGDAGIGKSYAALQMAWEAAIGEPWLGFWKVHRPLNTLVIQLEVSEPLFRKRYLRLRHTITPDPSNLWFLSDETFQINEDTSNEVARTVSELMQGEGYIDLVVLDPLYLMHSGDENSVEEVRPTMHMIDSIRRRYNTAFMIVHHVNKRSDFYGQPLKPSMSSIRGSSAWAGWVDTILYFQRESSDILQGWLLKARNRESSLPDTCYRFEWNNGPGKFLHPLAADRVPMKEKDLTLQQNDDSIFKAFTSLDATGKGKVSREALARYLMERKWPKATAYRRISKLIEDKKFEYEDGMLRLVKD